MDRRELLAGLLATGGHLAFTRVAGAQSAASARPYRIDIHHHFAPPAWVTEVKGRPLLQPANTTWTPEKSIEDMDRGGGRLDHEPRTVVRRRTDDAAPRAGVQRLRRHARARPSHSLRAVRGDAA